METINSVLYLFRKYWWN